MGDVGFILFVEVAAWQQDSAVTFPANQSYIRAQTHDCPFIRPAWMLLSQADDIAQLNFDIHNQALYHASCWQMSAYVS